MARFKLIWEEPHPVVEKCRFFRAQLLQKRFRRQASAYSGFFTEHELGGCGHHAHLEAPETWL